MHVAGMRQRVRCDKMNVLVLYNMVKGTMKNYITFFFFVSYQFFTLCVNCEPR